MSKLSEGRTFWYKDAVIYELHVRSFYDSNGDGMGDFRGLADRLGYLEDLGVNAIWLLPFYPSPWRDDGYDISDYSGVHSAYGNIRDFKQLIKEAHNRGIRVITELVVNHTSNAHPWFERARRAKPGSRFRDYYVWSDTPNKYTEARIIFKDTETSNWTWDPVAKAYYWHRFYSHQPDLNFENEEVQRAIFQVLEYWLSMGVDGLRLDAVPYLFESENSNCENLPGTHEFLRKLRAHVDAHYPDCMLLAEANQWPEDAVAYFGQGAGDECHMCFHFPLMPRLFMAMKMEDRFPVLDILDQTPPIPEIAQWGIFLRNHDELTLEMVTDEERDYMYQVYGRDPRQRLNLGIRRRLAPLLDNNRRQIELMNILLFSLPGTPVLYYGDELGMGDNVYLGDRNGVRTPMQWSPDKNAGFSACNPQRLYLPIIIDPEYHYEALNIETQQANTSSLLWWMKRVIATRRRFKAFSRGQFVSVNSNNTHVLAFIRQYEEEAILVVVNFSRYVQVVELDLGKYAGQMPREVFSQNEFPRIKDGAYPLFIGANDYYWFAIEKVEDTIGVETTDSLPAVAVSVGDWKSFSRRLGDSLQSRYLQPYIKNARWFRRKSATVRRSKIVDAIPVGADSDRAWVLLIRLDFADETSGTYVVPVALALTEFAEHVTREYPQSIIARVNQGNDTGVVYDGIYNESVRAAILTGILQRKRFKPRIGELIAHRAKGLRVDPADGDAPFNSRVLRAEQTNSSILYKDKYFFKLYRQLDDGQNPDIELSKFLTEGHRFHNTPRYVGDIEYRGDGLNRAAMGVLVEFVPNQGDAWEYAQSAVDRYFEAILSRQSEFPRAPQLPGTIVGLGREDLPQEFVDVADDYFMQTVALLGRRTGELHLGLASGTEDPDFSPEPFSSLYQRSVYQSMRNQFRRVVGMAKKLDTSGNPDLAERIGFVVSHEEAILAQFSRIREQRLKTEKIRIHGDFHLGQVLYTGKDFIIIDMEGEPARPLSERRLKYCPFRDVAGMLRSFHYCVSGRFLHRGAVRPEDSDYLRQWVEPWYLAVSGVFLEEYLNTVNGAAFLPDSVDDIQLLLDVFILGKAVYELGYEIDNRPDWVKIPIEGIRYIVERGSVAKA